MATGGVAVSNKVGATLKLNLQFMVPSGSIKDHLSTILIAVPETYDISYRPVRISLSSSKS